MTVAGDLPHSRHSRAKAKIKPLEFHEIRAAGDTPALYLAPRHETKHTFVIPVTNRRCAP
jgi:hypothetical protein